MNRQTPKKVTLVDFFRSIQFNEQKSNSQRSPACATHFAGLVSPARTAATSSDEEHKLVRSAN